MQSTLESTVLENVVNHLRQFFFICYINITANMI